MTNEEQTAILEQMRDIAARYRQERASENPDDEKSYLLFVAHSELFSALMSESESPAFRKLGKCLGTEFVECVTGLRAALSPSALNPSMGQ